MIKRRLAAPALVAALALAAPAAASAHGHEHPPTEPPAEKTKCNSGRGNLSETTPANDCDPGKSGGVNQGGD